MSCALLGAVPAPLGYIRRRFDRSASCPLGGLGRVAMGMSKIEAQRGDWRFADAAWTENPGSQRLMQAYLAWSEAMLAWADDPDADWRTTERARFGMTVLTPAVAPTSFFLPNPAALKRAFETGGKSMARGARAFLRDLRRNGGMPAQVQEGAVLAAAPGTFVHGRL